MMKNKIIKKISRLLDERNEEWHLNEKNIMYTALKKRFGPEVDTIIREAIGKRSADTWRRISGMVEEPTLDTLLKLIFDPLPRAGWEYTKEVRGDTTTFCITKCPKAELAKRLGAEKLMYLLACDTDVYSARGFNENIVFERTKTLMEGCECCDHTYRMKSSEKDINEE